MYILKDSSCVFEFLLGMGDRMIKISMEMFSTQNYIFAEFPRAFVLKIKHAKFIIRF